MSPVLPLFLLAWDGSNNAMHNDNKNDLYSDDQDDFPMTSEMTQDTIVQLLMPYHNQELLTIDKIVPIQQQMNNGPCEALSNMDLHCYKDRFYEIPFYTEGNLQVTNSMLHRVNQLATILSGLATYIFNIPVVVMRIYRDSNDKNPRKLPSFLIYQFIF